MKISLFTPKSLRQKLFVLYHNDGILDILVGLVIVSLSAIMASEIVALIGLILIPINLYIPMKDKLVVPRMGYIRFESKQRVNRMLMVAMLAGVCALVLFLLLYMLRPPFAADILGVMKDYTVPVFALALSGVLLAAGQILKNNRFFFYAIISLVLIVAAYFIGIRAWIPVMVVGLSMLSCGSFKLVRFLKEYPL